MDITIHIPTFREALGYWKAALLLAVLAMTLVWPGTLSQFGSSNTEAATDGAAMSLRVDASQTINCAGGPIAGKVCVELGAKFDVIVVADAIPLTNGYYLAQAWINYDNQGLVHKKNTVALWPDCDFFTAQNDANNGANAACMTGLIPPSRPASTRATSSRSP